jgi:hypothetical protein
MFKVFPVDLQHPHSRTAPLHRHCEPGATLPERFNCSIANGPLQLYITIACHVSVKSFNRSHSGLAVLTLPTAFELYPA